MEVACLESWFGDVVRLIAEADGVPRRRFWSARRPCFQATPCAPPNVLVDAIKLHVVDVRVILRCRRSGVQGPLGSTLTCDCEEPT